MTSGSLVRIAFAAASVTVLLLSGCAPRDAGPSTNPATSTPTPTASVVPVVTTAPPAQFPAGCDQLLVASELKAITFADLKPVAMAAYQTPLARAAETQAGVLKCSWTSRLVNLQFTVERGVHDEVYAEYRLPAAADAEVDTLGADRSELGCEGDENFYTCSVVAVDGDYFITGQFTVDDYIYEKHEIAAMFTKVFTPAITRLTAEPEPAVWEAPAGSWPLLLDCAEIETGGEVADAFGNDALIPARIAFDRFGEPLPSDAEGAGGETTCVWSDTTGDAPEGSVTEVALLAVAGGAWYGDLVETGSGVTVTVVEVEGTDDASVRCVVDAQCTLSARIGSNAFEFRGAIGGAFSAPVQAKDLIAAAPAIVAGLRAASD